MNVLVTGGAGCIGSHSVDALLARGAKVTVFDNFGSGRRANLAAAHGRLTRVEGDAAHGRWLRRACEGISHVPHLAARPAAAAGAIAAAGRTPDTRGFANGFDAARRNGMARVVCAAGAAQESPDAAANDHCARLYHEQFDRSAMGLRSAIGGAPKAGLADGLRELLAA